jgi:GT2 family glycosyltransferase
MTKQHSVSIHIVTFNSGAHVSACLEAVFRQSYPNITDVVVVDNASKDDTLQRLQPFSSSLLLIRNADNLGFAAAHNQAIRATDSDFFLVLNPDVVLHRDYVSELVREMTARPKAGSATGLLVRSAEPDTVDSTGLILTRSRRAFDRGQGDRAANWKEPGEVFGVSGAAAMYSRAMADDIMLDGEFFDETFFAYKEDVDVAWRARLAGWQAYYIPAALAHHERGWKRGGRASQPLFVRRHSYINRYYMMLKNDRWSDVLRDIPWLGIYELSSFAYFLLREPKVLGAWRDFGKNVPGMLKKRRKIQSGRITGNVQPWKY